ncbi:MAG TPA: FAD-dependent oxidoreductase, partial [Actinomycetota bacterium]|nr:FAD-dependent oxidoreductase [Actinomycetota bacterium]
MDPRLRIPRTSPTPDPATSVAVVGAGVIGLSCARELARAGAPDVVVLERHGQAAQGSTSRANGGFRAQFTTAPNVVFSLWSIDELERLEAATGLLSMHQTGYLLFTGTAEGERGLRAGYELQRSLGVATEWLSATEVLDRAPFLRADGLRVGTFHARDGILDPYGVARAMEREARALGVRIVTDAEVRAIRRTRDGFRLQHDGGGVEASWLVNAAGSDAREIGAMLGVEVPVTPYRRNLAFAPDPARAGELIPMCVDLD